jgi:hypothetical protein
MGAVKSLGLSMDLNVIVPTMVYGAGEASTHLLFVLQTPYAIFFAVPSTSSTHGSPALSP